MRQYRGGKGLSNITNQDVLLSSASFAEYSSPGMLFPEHQEGEKTSQEGGAGSMMSDDLFETPVNSFLNPF